VTGGVAAGEGGIGCDSAGVPVSLPPPAVGHASGLTAVRFSYDDRYIVTAGGEDLCLLVWRVEETAEASGGPASGVRPGGGQGTTSAGGAGMGARSLSLGGGVEVGRTFHTSGGDGAVDSTSATAVPPPAVLGGGVVGEEGEEDEGDDSDVEVVGLGGIKCKPRAAGGLLPPAVSFLLDGARVCVASLPPAISFLLGWRACISPSFLRTCTPYAISASPLSSPLPTGM
jgi:hypothetical protein